MTTAAEQGASIEEMEKACDLARNISGSVVNASAPKTVSKIRNDVETIIKSISEQQGEGDEESRQKRKRLASH